ncbi:MAG: hypothetical protein AABX55_00465 [Nanoarchaeota archaeon]
MLDKNKEYKIKFLVDKLKIKDREELQRIINEIKTHPYKASYPKEAKILKKFILAILKTYETGKKDLPKVPSYINLKPITPSYIKFNLAKTINMPRKIKL